MLVRFFFEIFYRVDLQCCPGGNCPETPRRPSAGGLRIFWLNHWQIQTKLSKKCKKKFFLKILSGFVIDFSQNNRRPPAEGLRSISAGTTLLVHTVNKSFQKKWLILARFQRFQRILLTVKLNQSLFFLEIFIRAFYPRIY